MPSLVLKLCLLIFVTALSVAQFAAAEGPADNLWNSPYHELESQVPAVHSTIGENHFLTSPRSDSPEALTTQKSNECKPTPNHDPIRMRSKRDRCPKPIVDHKIESPGQDTRPTSQTDSRPNANGSPEPNGQTTPNPRKQPWWQKFINLGNEIRDPKPCKHYRPFAVCAPPFNNMYTLFEIPLIQFCRLYDPTFPCNGVETLWCCVMVKIWAPSPQDLPDPSLLESQEIRIRLAYPDAGATCVLQEKLWFAPG